MNFTREIKRDLIKNMQTSPCFLKAALCGLLAASGVPRGEDIVFTTESEEAASFALATSERLFSVRPELFSAVYDPKQGRDKLSFSLKQSLLKTKTEEEEGAFEGFLKGAFLGGGSCTLPKEGKKTGYHLEVCFEREQGAEQFSDFCVRLGLLSPGLIGRKGRTVAYFKSREAISDFLAVLHADGALGILERISEAREESNLENRKGNCYARNLDKAAIASAEQILAIGRLREEGILGRLTPELRETANARVENPELTLGELAKKLNLSKSCLYHRLQKLTSLAGAHT